MNPGLELAKASWEVAPRILGSLLVRDIGGKKLIGKIVETEAYDQTDAASHSYRGRTPRTDVIFGPSGRAYVYFTYGMHHCFNIVTGKDGYGSAVLIRAIEPFEGIGLMKKHRGLDDINKLTNGPAKLCQALKIDKTFNGHDLGKPPIKLQLMPRLPKNQIVTATRIGITKDSHRPWRFYCKDNAWVSAR